MRKFKVNQDRLVIERAKKLYSYVCAPERTEVDRAEGLMRLRRFTGKLHAISFNTKDPDLHRDADEILKGIKRLDEDTRWP